MIYWGLPIKAWTTIAGFVMLACGDILSWRKAVGAAHDAHEKAPAFDWWTAIPKWIMGTIGGGVIGLGTEMIPEVGE